MYVSTTLFSASYIVSGFVDITISPALIFSIATRPLAVNIIVPATKQVIVFVIPPVKTEIAEIDSCEKLDKLLNIIKLQTNYNLN